jgi:Ca2+/H+ antiporter, TMEM165/GDT1 family
VVRSSNAVLVVAVFLASAVEMVEALTIVIAVGVTRGWRSALQGAGAAVAVLAGLVALVGAPLVTYVPLSTLRIVVGVLLLVFGLQWLQKAVLRSAGLKAKHDEDTIFQTHVHELQNEEKRTRGRDTTAFTVAFKGVALEGFEVIVIVITLGATQHRLGLAALAAAAALVLVGVVGAVVARQLSAVPENLLKAIVGVALVSYGTFWTGEGIGVHWPGRDLALLVLVGVYAVVAWGLGRLLSVRRPGEVGVV